jgi:hypothetical protein
MEELNKPQLIQDLKELLSLNNEGKSNVEETIQLLANAIERYVKSGKVIGYCPPGGGDLQKGKVT